MTTNLHCQSLSEVCQIVDIDIAEEETHRVLGLTISNTLSWTSHVYGKGQLLSSLHQRIGALKRIAYHLPSKFLPQIAQAIVVSKLCYGVGLYGSVRMHEADTLPDVAKELQVVLNDTMRIATKTRLMDRIRITDLMDRTGIRSFNRMSAEDKLTLIWQAVREEDSPLSETIERLSNDDGMTSSRSRTRGDLRTLAKTSLGQRNFPEPGVRLWNQASQDVRGAINKQSAKKAIKTFTNNLPL